MENAKGFPVRSSLVRVTSSWIVSRDHIFSVVCLIFSRHHPHTPHQHHLLIHHRIIVETSLILFGNGHCICICLVSFALPFDFSGPYSFPPHHCLTFSAVMILIAFLPYSLSQPLGLRLLLMSPTHFRSCQWLARLEVSFNILN